jgi:hypothetical protein
LSQAVKTLLLIDGCCHPTIQECKFHSHFSLPPSVLQHASKDYIEPPINNIRILTHIKKKVSKLRNYLYTR